ncbi:Gustatory receptor 154b [Halyomorpha halys]|nr:Gustatory receptor 154b [Halyomorpha halys]
MEEVTVKFNSMVQRIHLLPCVLTALPLYISDGRYKLSYVLVFFCLLTKVASGYEALLHLSHPPIITKGMSRFYKFFTVANFEYNFGVSCYSFAKVFFTKKGLNDMLDLMRKSDRMLSDLGESLDFRTNIIQDCIVLLMMSLPTTIRFLNLSSLTIPAAAEQIYLTWINFTIYLSIAPFLQFVFVLKKRFHLLSRSLLNSAARKQEAKLEQLIIIHTDYCDASSMLNDCFSQQILLAFTVTFMSIVLGSYRSIAAYALGSRAFVTVVKALVSSQYMILTVVITIICESAASEAKEFNALLYQLMIDDKTNDIATNKKLQLHIAMKREVQFTACGFFTLDYTLVHSMIAAATTYLVILIQFGQSTTSATFLPSASPFANTTFPTELSTAQH